MKEGESNSYIHPEDVGLTSRTSVPDAFANAFSKCPSFETESHDAKPSNPPKKLIHDWNQ